MSGNQGEVNDNPDEIDPGNAVNFPKPDINPYGTIQRLQGSNSEFVLPANGVFEIIFQVGVQNTGELVVVLNGTELLFTVVGKPGNGEIIGISIISTPSGVPSVLSINNPTTSKIGIPSVLNIIDPSNNLKGGLKIDAATGALSQPLSCHLIIKQLV
jgi:hypothetical protein